jgi:hypothetical protein
MGRYHARFCALVFVHDVREFVLRKLVLHFSCRNRKGSVSARQRRKPYQSHTAQQRPTPAPALTDSEMLFGAVKELILELSIPPNANKREFLLERVTEACVTAFRCKSTDTLPCSLPSTAALCTWYDSAQTQKGRAELQSHIDRVRGALRAEPNPLTALLPVSTVLHTQMLLPARTNLLDYFQSINSRILSNYQLKQQQQQQQQQPSGADPDDGPGSMKGAFERGSASSPLTRSAKYCSSIATFLGQQHTVAGGLRALRDSPDAAKKEGADSALPKPATAARWVKLDNEHRRRKSIQLLHGLPLITNLDSGKKAGENYLPIGVAAFIERDNLVYAETIDVQLLSGGTAEDYDKARQAAFEKAGLEERAVIGVNSDCAPNIVGCHAGANELARQRLGCRLSLDFPCLAHGYERSFKYGIVAMTGEPSEGCGCLFVSVLDFLFICSHAD